MTSLSLLRPSIWNRFQEFWKTLEPAQDDRPSIDAAQEDARVRRDIALEMLDRNPEAFQSELDIQTMARLYRCRY